MITTGYMECIAYRYKLEQEKEKENEKDPNVEIEGAEMVDDLEKLSNELEEASKLIDDIPDEEFE